MKYITLIALVCLLGFQYLAAEAVAIVNKDCPDASISSKDLQNMYLDKKGSWSDGSKITIYTNAGDVSEVFMSSFVGKSSSQFKAFWKKKVFTGKGRMPDEFADDAAVIKAVAAQPGSVGYIDKANATTLEGVKVLEVKE